MKFKNYEEFFADVKARVGGWVLGVGRDAYGVDAENAKVAKGRKGGVGGAARTFNLQLSTFNFARRS